MNEIQSTPAKQAERGQKRDNVIPATIRTWRAFSPRTRNTTLRCDESMFAFSSKKTRSTPYSWSTENLTNSPTGPASSWLMTRFFLPRAWRIVSADQNIKELYARLLVKLRDPSAPCPWSSPHQTPIKEPFHPGSRGNVVAKNKQRRWSATAPALG